MSDLQTLPAPPPAAPPEHKRSHTREGIKSILSTLLLIVAAPLLAITMIAFVFQSYQVDGPSMQNTLHNNDRLIVYKLPKTISRITKHQYKPKRYDIIVFERSDLINADFTHDSSKQLIKRVIGVPGDRVIVKDGSVTVYNKEKPEGFNPDAGTSYQSSIAETQGNIDTLVKDDQLFVMGDNRGNSLDSRYFGPITDNEVIGKLVLRLWPDGKSF